MLRSTLILTVLLTFFTFHGFAQKSAVSFSFFSHATSLPGGTWAGAVHPGLDIGLQTRLREKENSRTFLTWKLGYYYHRLVHHGLQIYGEYNWDFKLFRGLRLGVAGGLGYLHTFEKHEIFKLEDSGDYRRVGRLGKAHAQISIASGLLYQASSLFQPFIQYRFRMVTPFVREYVPLLPATSIHIGLYVPITPSNHE